MDLFDDFFKDDKEDLIIHVEQPEMTEMGKSLWGMYGNAWSSVRLTDAEYPHESICEQCTGCGTFKLENGNDGECAMDRSEGECFHRHFDAQQFGEEVASYLEG